MFEVHFFIAPVENGFQDLFMLSIIFNLERKQVPQHVLAVVFSLED